MHGRVHDRGHHDHKSGLLWHLQTGTESGQRRVCILHQPIICLDTFITSARRASFVHSAPCHHATRAAHATHAARALTMAVPLVVMVVIVIVVVVMAACGRG